MAIFKHHAKIEALEKSLNESLSTALSAEEQFQFAEFDEAEVERSGYSNYSYWRSTLKMFSKNRIAMFLLVLMAALVLFTFIQPYLPGQIDYFQVNNDSTTGMPLRNVPPGDVVELTDGTQFRFILGSNNIG